MLELSISNRISACKDVRTTSSRSETCASPHPSPSRDGGEAAGATPELAKPAQVRFVKEGHRNIAHSRMR